VLPEKNPKDASAIAQAKRREAKHVGAVKPKGQIKSAGFPKSDKPKTDKLALPPRRNLYEADK
jgi:hypothetical protein